MFRLGFSTGALAKEDFRAALLMLKDRNVQVVELSALREVELLPLISSLSSLDLSQFSYVSVHAPSKIFDEKRVVELLTEVKNRNWSIVVHPDSIQDWSLWEIFGKLLCIENMDNRKPIGRTALELGDCFEKVPEASFCFDVGHVLQIDPTCKEAFSIIDKFAARLGQVHLSVVDSDSKHRRLNPESISSFVKIFDYISSIRSNYFPVVLETPVCEEQIDDELVSAALINF